MWAWLKSFISEPSTGKGSITRLTILLTVLAALVVVGVAVFILVKHHDWITQGSSVTVYIGMLLGYLLIKFASTVLTRGDPSPSDDTVSNVVSEVSNAIGSVSSAVPVAPVGSQPPPG